MSKNNKNEKKNNKQEVFMQISSDKTDEKVILKVPSHYKALLNRLMADTDCKDYHNSGVFCSVNTKDDK